LQALNMVARLAHTLELSFAYSTSDSLSSRYPIDESMNHNYVG